MDFPLHIWGCTLHEAASRNVAEASERMPACGVGLDSQSALAGALGEGCERYAFAVMPPLRTESVCGNGSLNSDDITALSFFLSAKAKTVADIAGRLKKEADWIELSRWPSGSKRRGDALRLPAAMLFADRSEFAIPASSSGMAAGPIVEFALYRAVAELIERDAFMCAWAHRFAGKRIDEACILPAPIVAWIRRMRELNLDFRLHDISSDIPPFRSFLGYVLRMRDKRPVAAAFGAGCSLDPHTAALRAFMEAALCWRGADELLAVRGPMSPREFARFRPRSFSDHVYLYQNEASIPALQHLLREKPISCRYSHGIQRRECDKLNAATLALARRGFRLFYLDVTPPQVRPLNVVVIRAVVPGLVPLSWGGYRPVPSDRLVHPEWIPSALHRRLLNTDTHPFP